MNNYEKINDIEQQFFKTFGIEPIMLCDCEFKNLYDYRIEYGQDVCIHIESKAKNPCLKCKLAKQTHPLYPEITAEILLELICILSGGLNVALEVKAKTVEEFKEALLHLVIKIARDALNIDKDKYNKYKHQVRALFESEAE